MGRADQSEGHQGRMTRQKEFEFRWSVWAHVRLPLSPGRRFWTAPKPASQRIASSGREKGSQPIGNIFRIFLREEVTTGNGATLYVVSQCSPDGERPTFVSIPAIQSSHFAPQREKWASISSAGFHIVPVMVAVDRCRRTILLTYRVPDALATRRAHGPSMIIPALRPTIPICKVRCRSVMRTRTLSTNATGAGSMMPD